MFSRAGASGEIAHIKEWEATARTGVDIFWSSMGLVYFVNGWMWWLLENGTKAGSVISHGISKNMGQFIMLHKKDFLKLSHIH